MKFYLKLTLLSILFLIFNCTEIQADQEKGNTEKQIKDINKRTTEIPKIRKHFKFITAESGLNYRDKPNGKVIGKFNWRDKVEYLFYTKHTQKIIDNYREIEGTWVAVKQEKDTVFVFDHYLSNNEPNISRIKLYDAQAYYSSVLKPSNKKDIRQAFINVSESFYMPENFIPKKDLRKDTIHFNTKQRTESLKRMNYSINDTIFIYDMESGLVKKHTVKETPLMACISIYAQIKDEYKKEDYNQWDYEIGFNLKKTNYGGFAVIGKENPFIEKGLEPLVFEEISQKIFDIHIKNKLIPNHWKNDTIYKIYTSTYGNIRSFVKRKSGYNNWTDLIVKNIKTQDSFLIYQSGGEGSGKAPIKIKGDKTTYNETYQYIGLLFRNKPPVAFGFVWESFGCPIINFLDEEELPILILCDNRH